MRSNGPLANKEVAMGGPVASGPASDIFRYIKNIFIYRRLAHWPFLQTGGKWPFGPPHEPSRRFGRDCRRSSNRAVGCRSRASPTVRSGGGYFNARIADSDSSIMVRIQVP